MIGFTNKARKSHAKALSFLIFTFVFLMAWRAVFFFAGVPLEQLTCSFLNLL